MACFYTYVVYTPFLASERGKPADSREPARSAESPPLPQAKRQNCALLEQSASYFMGWSGGVA